MSSLAVQVDGAGAASTAFDVADAGFGSGEDLVMVFA